MIDSRVRQLRSTGIEGRQLNHMDNAISSRSIGRSVEFVEGTRDTSPQHTAKQTRAWGHTQLGGGRSIKHYLNLLSPQVATWGGGCGCGGARIASTPKNHSGKRLLISPCCPSPPPCPASPTPSPQPQRKGRCGVYCGKMRWLSLRQTLRGPKPWRRRRQATPPRSRILSAQFQSIAPGPALPRPRGERRRHHDK